MSRFFMVHCVDGLYLTSCDLRPLLLDTESPSSVAYSTQLTVFWQLHPWNERKTLHACMVLEPELIQHIIHSYSTPVAHESYNSPLSLSFQTMLRHALSCS